METPSLSAHVGPLPLWAWGLVGGGGFLLWRHHQSSGGTGLLSGIIGSKSETTANPGADITTTSTDQSPTAFNTNDDWANGAVDGLIASGYDPLQAQTAIDSYLSGSPLDPSMATLVDTALRGQGAPPDVTSTPPGAVTSPVVASPSQPKATHTGLQKKHGHNHHGGTPKHHVASSGSRSHVAKKHVPKKATMSINDPSLSTPL